MLVVAAVLAAGVSVTDVRTALAQATVAREEDPIAAARALLDAGTAPATDAPPVRPERLYNAGVSMYRAGELELARDLFAAAAERAKAGVAARSMYNRGTTSYAEAVRAMESAGRADGSTNPQELQKEVIDTLERSLRELKDAARADPRNTDARANAELAHRVLKELKKQQEQQQQQQQQNQDQQQSGEQNGEQNQQNQQQQNGEQPEKNDDQKNESGGEQDQPQQDQRRDGQEDQDQQRDGQKGQESEAEESKPDQATPDEPRTDEAKPNQPKAENRKPMTRQEVERLLQRIRDKERARVMERMERERARTQPAPKDW
jgi:Ca-activated chloride channel family protein